MRCCSQSALKPQTEANDGHVCAIVYHLIFIDASTVPTFFCLTNSDRLPSELESTLGSNKVPNIVYANFYVILHISRKIVLGRPSSIC